MKQSFTLLVAGLMLGLLTACSATTGASTDGDIGVSASQKVSSDRDSNPKVYGSIRYGYNFGN